ncbi:lactonase family protein [Crateriforma conspicua]|uniref:6-phosphogluconolactonase n=1 Tax=Crateriforma conspicua TaxID=2527996 RepID=A0A5C6FNV8_9PLAN|nr:lactonase family protein [Crateriforma conspicua]TWU64812.1 6-phosphogluconolactonase [Crateriforma conspicua]
MRSRRLTVAVGFSLFAATLGQAATSAVFFGTTTPRGGTSQGIYQGQFDSDSGKLTNIALAAELSNPGFVAKHPTLDILYSTGAIDGQAVVAAYKIDRDADGSWLTPVGHQEIGDGGAAHLSTDRSGKVLMSAQYGGGSVAVFPLADDGTIQPRSDLQKHSGGSGVVDRRQDKPHAHWVGTSPDNRFVFVPDLGLDRVVIYRLDAENAKLTPHGEGVCPPGGGPRHMKFSPDGDKAYVLNELALSVTVFDYDAKAGTMAPVQTIETLSEETKAKETFNSAAEIRVHPSGKFVYTSNRGHDSISAFRVDDESGKLSAIEVEPIRGGWPRNFNLDPSGSYLLAAGRDSNTVTVFAIDSESGELTYTRNMAVVPTPICVEFASH